MGKVKEDKKVIGVQLPDYLKEKLQEEANYYCLTMSAMIRLIIAQRYRDFAKLNDEEKEND